MSVQSQTTDFYLSIDLTTVLESGGATLTKETVGENTFTTSVTVVYQGLTNTNPPVSESNVTYVQTIENDGTSITGWSRFIPNDPE